MSSSKKFKAAIIVISDTAFADPGSDKATAILCNTFAEEGNGQWEVLECQIIPDDEEAIHHAVVIRSASESKCNLIVTTGGTGFATRDITPEVIEPLLERKAPGLVHGMLASSLQVTPFAMMSRPVAGVRNGVIIVTLPGSPKGAKENLEAIIKLLPHACLQATGGNSRELHIGGTKKLEEDAGVSTGTSSAAQNPHKGNDNQRASTHVDHGHGCGHHVPKPRSKPEDRPRSNDPSAGPTNRYRESPYPMLSVADAITTILNQTPSPSTRKIPVSEDIVGAILAESVTATEAVPAYRASIVDGYAITTSKDAPTTTKGIFPVVSVSHASPGSAPPLQSNQVARITTGAPLPLGATAVVMVEDTVLKSMTSDGKEEKEIEVLVGDIEPGENVREIGSDIEAGAVILESGEKIGPGELGLLASVGCRRVSVYQRPVVGIMSTGNEIVPHDLGGELRLGEVRDCNRPALLAMIRNWGFEAVDLGISRDSSEELEESLRRAFRQANVIVTTGGASMGELDLLKPTLERLLGGTIHFGRVSMKPGKPTTFATVPIKSSDGNPESRLVFSLPGNPASAAVTAGLFVLPSLKKASGVGSINAGPADWRTAGLPRTVVTLDNDVTCDKTRDEYQRATVSFGNGGSLRAATTGGQRSSRVASFRGANALLELKAGGGIVKAGSHVEALLMGDIR